VKNYSYAEPDICSMNCVGEAIAVQILVVCRHVARGVMTGDNCPPP